MPITTYQAFAQTATATGTGATWTNLANISKLFGNYVDATISMSGQTTQTLELTNFNHRLPSVGTIKGVTCRLLDATNSSTKRCTDQSVALILQGAAGNAPDSYINRNQDYTSSKEPSYWGGPSNLWGETSLTPAQLSDPTSGFSYQALYESGLGSVLARVDAAIMEVHVETTTLEPVIDLVPVPNTRMAPCAVIADATLSGIAEARQSDHDFRWHFGETGSHTGTYLKPGLSGSTFDYGSDQETRVACYRYDSDGTFDITLGMRAPSTFKSGDTSYTTTSTSITIAPFSGSKIYVSALGSDTTGDGSLANPYATLAKAFTAGGSSDNVWIIPRYGDTFTVAASLLPGGNGWKVGPESGFGSGAKPRIQSDGIFTDDVFDDGGNSRSDFFVFDTDFIPNATPYKIANVDHPSSTNWVFWGCDLNPTSSTNYWAQCFTTVPCGRGMAAVKCGTFTVNSYAFFVEAGFHDWYCSSFTANKTTTAAEANVRMNGGAGPGAAHNLSLSYTQFSQLKENIRGGSSFLDVVDCALYGGTGDSVGMGDTTIVVPIRSHRWLRNYHSAGGGSIGTYEDTRCINTNVMHEDALIACNVFFNTQTDNSSLQAQCGALYTGQVSSAQKGRGYFTPGNHRFICNLYGVDGTVNMKDSGDRVIRHANSHSNSDLPNPPTVTFKGGLVTVSSANAATWSSANHGKYIEQTDSPGAVTQGTFGEFADFVVPVTGDYHAFEDPDGTIYRVPSSPTGPDINTASWASGVIEETHTNETLTSANFAVATGTSAASRLTTLPDGIYRDYLRQPIDPTRSTWAVSPTQPAAFVGTEPQWPQSLTQTPFDARLRSRHLLRHRGIL